MTDVQEAEWAGRFFPKVHLFIWLVWTPGAFLVAYLAGWL